MWDLHCCSWWTLQISHLYVCRVLGSCWDLQRRIVAVVQPVLFQVMSLVPTLKCLLSLLCVRQAGLENTWELDVRFGVRIFYQCSPKLTACRQACFSSQNSFWRGNCCQQLCFMLFDLTRLSSKSSGLSIVSSAFCPSKGGLLNPGSRKSVHKLLCFFNVSQL